MGVNALLLKVLEEVGIKPERFSLKWASAAEAPRFVKLITQFTEDVKKLGPLGEAEGLEPEELKARLTKALEVMEDRKVRMFFGNATKALRKDGIFTQEHISAVIDEKMTKTVKAALQASKKDAPAEADIKGKKTAAKKAVAKKPAEKKPAAPKAPVKKAAAKKGPARKAAPAKKAAPAAGKETKTATAKKAAAPKKKAAVKITGKKKTTAAKKKK